jgi:hypothetical protein
MTQQMWSRVDFEAQGSAQPLPIIAQAQGPSARIERVLEAVGALKDGISRFGLA